MKYYIINTLPQHDPDLHVLRDPPSSIAHIDYYGREGTAFGALYPREASVRMSKVSSGRRLGGLVASIQSFLILRKELKDLIVAHDKRPELIEVLPLGIIDHRGNRIPLEFFIVNPIGSVDCIDKKQSDLEWDSTGTRILRIRQLVLRASAIDPDRAVFRPEGYPSIYIGREDWLREAKNRITDVPRNLYATEIILS